MPSNRYKKKPQKRIMQSSEDDELIIDFTNGGTKKGISPEALLKILRKIDQ